MNYQLTTLSLLAVLSAPAFADEAMRSVNDENAKMFVEATIGQTEQELSLDGYSGDVSEKESTLSFKAGYWVSDNVAISLGYTDLGDVEYKDISGTVDGLDISNTGEGKAVTVSATFSTPLWQKPWRFYAELGLAKWNYTWETTVSNGFQSLSGKVADDDGIDFFGGLGLGYTMTDNLEFVAGAEWYTMEPEMTEAGENAYGVGKADLQIQRLKLGLNYRF